VFDGVTGALVRSFFAYDERFTGGVWVAAGDVNGDGFADVITGIGAGGGPHVQAFSGRDGSVLMSFFAYAPQFAGGVRVAADDLNGDGFADVVTGIGQGGGPHVRAFSGKDGTELLSFYAYTPQFAGGVYVGAGDVNGDGLADVVTGIGEGGGPHVRAFSGDGTGLASFFAYDPQFAGGVRVAAGTDPASGRSVIVTGIGPGGGSTVRTFDGLTQVQLDSFLAFDADFTGGVFVGGKSAG
jgi:fibronectin-binding autotransporter adhesin